mgnify:CR=1 FL=1
MTIKHLVLGGGGAAGFTIYGALKKLNTNNFFDFKNIKSIHACSAGSIIAGLILIEQNWDLLDDYILKRPWDKLININPSSILNLWQQKGVFNENIMKEIIKPFLQAKDYSVDITLKDIYDITGIELFVYTTNINSLSLETNVLNYKTFPDLELYKAITMSSAFPLMFEPICIDGSCYIDGGLLNNFPLNECVNLNEDTKEILGIKIESNNENREKIQSDTVLPLYLYNIIFKMYVLINNMNTHVDIKNIITCNIKDNTFSKWSAAVSETNVRQEYIDIGIEYAEKFLATKDF